VNTDSVMALVLPVVWSCQTVSRHVWHHFASMVW